MKNDLSDEQINFYRTNGYILVEDFLSGPELAQWRETVEEAVDSRKGKKFPDKDILIDQDDGINRDAGYYIKVFDQLLNLWQTNAGIKGHMTDARIGKMAATLAGAKGIRIWHDQALFKRPWANPTAWHLDTPFWSFSDRKAISIWVALDDATLENGCLYFLPGSHLVTDFQKISIGQNMDGIFEIYPRLRGAVSVAVPMKAGSCSFHNGLTVHGAGPNMTSGWRRAMTCAFMPDGNVYNGEPNILPEPYLSSLKIGDLLDNEAQNPLIYSSNHPETLKTTI